MAQEAAKRPLETATPHRGSASGPHDPAFVATLSPASLVATDPFLSLPSSAPTAPPARPAPQAPLFHTPPPAAAADATAHAPLAPAVDGWTAGPTPRALPGRGHPALAASTLEPMDPDAAAAVDARHSPRRPAAVNTTAEPALISEHGAAARAAARHSSSSQGEPHPWQPSQMQHLAAAALASARSGSQPGASAASVDLEAADVLPLSQEMLDKPLACGGSTVLGAWEEEAALAALQSSRATSQHSAQQQAADAAQRAAQAVRAQHEAEVQAVLDMFTAEDFASPMMHGRSGSDTDDGGDPVRDKDADASDDAAGAPAVLAAPSLSTLLAFLGAVPTRR